MRLRNNQMKININIGGGVEDGGGKGDTGVMRCV
jgi:hypothetical protein